jgi:hypothetical protein
MGDQIYADKCFDSDTMATEELCSLDINMDACVIGLSNASNLNTDAIARMLHRCIYLNVFCIHL